MSIFIWLNKYNVNVSQVDQQHKRLVEILNELADAMSQGKGKEVLGDTLSRLIDYTVIHFKDEEAHFDAIDYPQADNHRKEHKLLLSKVSQFKAEYDAGKLNMTVDLMLFLKDWLIKHIRDTDKEFGRAMNRAGLN